MTSVSVEANLLIATLDTWCLTAPGSLGLKLTTRETSKTMHPAMELKGFQVQALLPCNIIRFFPNPTTPSTLDSLSLLSSWMNVRARATFRMTEAS